MAFIKCVLCQLKICFLCSLTVSSAFQLSFSLRLATIPIFYAFGPRPNVIEDPCSRLWSLEEKCCHVVGQLCEE